MQYLEEMSHFQVTTLLFLATVTWKGDYESHFSKKTSTQSDVTYIEIVAIIIDMCRIFSMNMFICNVTLMIKYFAKK